MAISSKQRFAALGTVGVAALVLAGCAPAPEAGDGAAEGASDFTACMVSDEGGFDDRSFNQLAHTGLENAESELGVNVLEAESATPDDYAANLTTMVDQGCKIIVPVGFKLADATAAAAEANPDVDFAIVDIEGLGIPNVLELNYDTAQAAFLAGYASAAYSKTGTVATYGGAAIPTVTIFMDGFANGVKHFNEVKGKDVKVIGWDVDSQQGSFVDDFTNVSRAKEISTGFLSQGADVILPVGGPLYQGAAEAIREGGQDAVILGVDSDLAVADEQYADIILVSIMKGLDVTVLDAISQSVDGTFEGGTTYTGVLENEGVGLSGFGAFESELPSGTLDEIDTLKQEVIDGKYPELSPSSPKV
ncbi:BMP family protein [Pseudoclavibacter sp. AY1H1]|uniref:BMP family lipoprotein n=1 Tax=Pseudoclavibacter sp. AY1H1 TaxID=2080584 RepID=UPI00215781EA|nr:BMP family ABC transporter substrate-binding protein [Pseudoclavibacter sp. AY1H1]